MAYSAITTTIAGQRPDGIRRVFVKTGSEKWQSLGLIRNGEIKLTPYSTKNTYQKNLTIGSHTFEAKFDLLQTAVLELEKLDSLCDGSTSFLFQLTDSGAIASGVTEGWVTVSNTQAGVKSAKFINDTDPSKAQYVEIMIQGILKGSEIAAALKAAVATADFHISTTASETYSNNAGTAGGTIFGYYLDATPANVIGIPGNIKPSGISSIALDDVTSSSAVTLGNTKNGKIVMEFISEDSGLLIPQPFIVDVNAEYEYLDTDAATLILLNAMNLTTTSAVITLLDGKVFTFSTELGVEIGFENVGDVKGNRILRFKHLGRILKSQFDGIVA